MRTACFIALLLLLPRPATAQQAQKEINHQNQSWFSINTTARFSQHWGASLDLHERRNNLFKDASFHFARVGINYWINDRTSIAAGYAHLWLAPTKPGWTLFANENRIYQQIQMSTAFKKLSLVQRLRNEQRWQQKIVDNKATGQNKFSNRVRYLLSCNYVISKNTRIPSLVVSDELCVQFGKEIVYNTFDQNRLFIGMKQQLSRRLSFDIGYMLVLQQKASGYQYDVNDTYRLFFYYTPDFRKGK